MNIKILIILACLFPAIALAEMLDHGNGTVTDTNTNLMWKTGSYGWADWYDATNHFSDLEYAGHYDWRLPNQDELMSIYNKADAIGLNTGCHWSSMNSGIFAWGMDFVIGSGGGFNDKAGKCYAVGVRSLPPDMDSDEVPDDQDKCPGTTIPLQVDAAGCSAPQNAAALESAVLMERKKWEGKAGLIDSIEILQKLSGQ